jgi:hypothetical protein
MVIGFYMDWSAAIGLLSLVKDFISYLFQKLHPPLVEIDNIGSFYGKFEDSDGAIAVRLKIRFINTNKKSSQLRTLRFKINDTWADIKLYHSGILTIFGKH